ncbi:DNA repair protein RecO [Brevibacillus dissolubilis]|uniref:DNA repair protein RecO n=1 Tax=Brevibacillus dissolubilis TaxID=1844116 RepID=UPI0011160C80|nr:DNA repair protein RecO [Brevibacillus dissolubilis]
MLVKWEGLVIRSVNYGESSKVVTLYTREHGKVGIMARGAKKPKSRLAAVSQLFTHGYYLCKKGAGTGMPDLSQGDIAESFKELRQDLVKTAYAAYIAELLDRLTGDQERNPYLFEMLLLLYRYIDEGRDPEILCRIFESKMLIVAGIRPHLHSCTSCGAEREPYVVSITQGGLLCPACTLTDPYAVSVTPGTWKLLRLFQMFDLERLGDIEVKDSTRNQLRFILHRFMDEHLDLRLKTRSFLEQVERLTPPGPTA